MSIKRHGGKSYLAKRIVELMPPRCETPNAPRPTDPGWLHYVEPYFGGGAVLFANDPEGISEVVNDLDFQLTNFWCALQGDDSFAEFVRRVEAIPVSSLSYDAAAGMHTPDWDTGGGMMGLAVNFFVANRQSRQALGKDFATLSRNRTRRGMNEQVSAWLSALEGLPEVHARLKRVAILNDPAVKVISQQDGERTLFYVDPPYMHETRTVTDAYEHEMTADDHKVLLEKLAKVKGRFLLSGYRSDLYDQYATANNWRREEWEIDNKSGSGKTKQKRVECVWMNY